jgi:hypothetical protein
MTRKKIKEEIAKMKMPKRGKKICLFIVTAFPYYRTYKQQGYKLW